jgi:hypothetical protein
VSWPRKVFIESTALFQLGPRLENVDFARLLKLREILGFEICVSDVNFREYVRFRKREIRQIRSRLQEVISTLEKYGQNYSEFEPILKQLDSFLTTIDKHFEERFKALGIKILPLPKVEIEKLVRMSLEGKAPFEKPRESPNERSSEKGFRDAVIMFTILEEIEDRSEDHALVITADDLLADGLVEHAPGFATSVNCVADIPAANVHISRQLSVSYQEALRKESEEAKAVLLNHKSALDAKIAEIREIEAMDFGGLFGVIKDENGNSLSLERVLSVKFGSIDGAIWKDRDQPESKILFRLKCEAKVVVRSPFFPMLGLPKYPLGESAVYSKADVSENFEKTVPIWFYGQAVLTKQNAEWILKDLRIDRRMPDKEDMVELLRVSMPTDLINKLAGAKSA